MTLFFLSIKIFLDIQNKDTSFTKKSAHLKVRLLWKVSQQTMASEFGKLQSLKSPMQQRKQHPQISGLLVASLNNSPLADDQDDITGKENIVGLL